MIIEPIAKASSVPPAQPIPPSISRESSSSDDEYMVPSSNVGGVGGKSVPVPSTSASGPMEIPMVSPIAQTALSEKKENK